MPIEYKPSTSPSKTLTVIGFPYGTVREFVIDYPQPGGAYEGDHIEWHVRVANTGDSPGDFWVDVIDDDFGNVVWTSGKLNILPGADAWFHTLNGPIMPGRSWFLLARAHHDAAVDGTMLNSIPIILIIATALSISIEPSTIRLEEDYLHSGRLTRVDTGAGIAGETVILNRGGASPDQRIAITDANGNYALYIPGPSSKGDFPCHTVYAGNVVLGYGGAVSRRVRLGVGVPEIPLLVPAISILSGLGLVYASLRR